MFDVRRFLDRHNVEYVEQGANVKKGNLNIACPFCGDDPSHHMGIDPKTLWWGCWRSPKHRGKSIVRLVAKIARCSFQEAASIVGVSYSSFEKSDLEKLASGDFYKEDESKMLKRKTKLTMPQTFRRLDDGRLAGRRFREHLMRRGFLRREIDDLTYKYDLRYCIDNSDFKWAGRVIFPMQVQGHLMSWTGRSIYPDEELRYRDLEVEQSFLPVKEILYNYDNAMEGGGVLFVVEGPMDVLKVDYFSSREECHAVGISTLSVSDKQKDFFLNLYEVYDKIVLLLDKSAWAVSNQLASELSFIEAQVDSVPREFKDPGEMGPKHIWELCGRHL